MQGERHVAIQGHSCKPRNAKGHKQPKLEEARRDSSLAPSEGAGLCQHADFRLVASGTVREYIPVGLTPTPRR